MKNKITPEQEKVIDTIHNLLWHRITHDDDYLNAIPEIESRDFRSWIYYMKYEFLECDDSVIQAIVYLNGIHYEYTEAPQIADGIIWVNDIDESRVKAKIEELRGEIYDGFEIYDPDAPLDEEVRKKLDGMLKGKLLNLQKH